MIQGDKTWRRNCEFDDAHQLWRLGVMLWQIPEEVLVERMLQADYPEFGGARAEQLARMRVARGSSLLQRCPASALTFGVLFEICGMKLALELPIPSDELRQACEAQLRSFEAQGETAGGDTWEGLRQTVDELFDVNVDQRSIPPTAGVGVCDRLRAEARALCAQASADQEGVIHGVS